MESNYYDLLGVERTATQAEIKKAYFGAMRQAHPDAGGSEDEASRINKAKEVLCDPEKRQEYDTILDMLNAPIEPAAKETSVSPEKDAAYSFFDEYQVEWNPIKRRIRHLDLQLALSRMPLLMTPKQDPLPENMPPGYTMAFLFISALVLMVSGSSISLVVGRPVVAVTMIGAVLLSMTSHRVGALLSWACLVVCLAMPISYPDLIIPVLLCLLGILAGKAYALTSEADAMGRLWSRTTRRLIQSGDPMPVFVTAVVRLTPDKLAIAGRTWPDERNCRVMVNKPDTPKRGIHLSDWVVVEKGAIRQVFPPYAAGYGDAIRARRTPQPRIGWLRAILPPLP